MANFCKFCGTKLEEGQACSCPQAQAELAAPAAAPAPEAAAPVATAAPAAPAGDSFVKKLLDTLKAYWKAPKETAAAVAEDAKGMTTACIFAGVNFLAVFFFLWRIIGLLMDGIKESAGGKVDMDEIREMLEIELPIFPMLLAGLAIAVIGIAATALVIFIAGKLNKQNVDLKKQIVIEAVHSVIPTALLVVGILLGFLAAWLQFIVLALILVLWFINVCGEIRDVAGVQAMETGKSLAINTLVLFVVLAAALWLISTIGVWGIGELSIQGHTINEALEEADNILEVLGGMF
jgi:hypothetical protein